MKNNKEERPLAYYMDAFQGKETTEIRERCMAAGEGNQFEMTYLSAQYAITHPDFEATCKNDVAYRPLDSAAGKILLLHFLTEGVKVEPTGTYLTYRDVPWGEVYYQNFKGRCIIRLARTFGKDISAFERACKALGGTRLSDGDVSYEIPFLDNLSVRLILWEPDDEFPASAQILFSDNFPLAFTAEDMAVVGDLVNNALVQNKN